SGAVPHGVELLTRRAAVCGSSGRHRHLLSAALSPCPRPAGGSRRHTSCSPRLSMRAVTIDRRGRVSIREVPVPSVGRREVRIAVDTAGVGSWDPSMRPEGRERFVVPGTDGSGVVVEIGSRIRRFRVGDRVYSYSYQNRKGGFHADFVVVDAKKVARLPRTLDAKP